MIRPARCSGTARAGRSVTLRRPSILGRGAKRRVPEARPPVDERVGYFRAQRRGDGTCCRFLTAKSRARPAVQDGLSLGGPTGRFVADWCLPVCGVSGLVQFQGRGADGNVSCHRDGDGSAVCSGGEEDLGERSGAAGRGDPRRRSAGAGRRRGAVVGALVGSWRSGVHGPLASSVDGDWNRPLTLQLPVSRLAT